MKNTMFLASVVAVFTACSCGAAVPASPGLPVLSLAGEWQITTPIELNTQHSNEDI
jgi:hypothetical protein